LLNKLKNSNESRIIVLTCRDYSKSEINFDDLNFIKNYTEEGAYNQSKLANVLFTMELKERLKDTEITVNCVDPGYVYSDLMKNSSVYKSPYSPVSFIMKLFLKTPLMGAQPVIFAAVSPSLNKISGKLIRYEIF
jgi:retinol dehydrogenase 13